MKLRHVLTLLCVSLSDFFFDIDFLFLFLLGCASASYNRNKKGGNASRKSSSLSFTLSLSHLYPFSQHIVIFPASQTPLPSSSLHLPLSLSNNRDSLF